MSGRFDFELEADMMRRARDSGDFEGCSLLESR